MGCNMSTSGFDVDQRKELKDYLSTNDILLVQASWELVQSDLENVGTAIFKRLFSQHKHLKTLFVGKFRADSGTCSLEDVVFDDSKLSAHGIIVMEALGAAVECLHDSDQLTLLLIGIGERHVMYGVDESMVPLLWPAIIATLEERLGNRFTPEVGLAWEHVFHYIGSKVIEGIMTWKSAMRDYGKKA